MKRSAHAIEAIIDGRHPHATAAHRRLLHQLAAGGELKLGDLYDMSYAEFELAIEILQDWWVGRFVYPDLALAAERGGAAPAPQAQAA
jgi:hypothetical protein